MRPVSLASLLAVVSLPAHAIILEPIAAIGTDGTKPERSPLSITGLYNFSFGTGDADSYRFELKRSNGLGSDRIVAGEPSITMQVNSVAAAIDFRNQPGTFFSGELWPEVSILGAFPRKRVGVRPIATVNGAFTKPTSGGRCPDGSGLFCFPIEFEKNLVLEESGDFDIEEEVFEAFGESRGFRGEPVFVDYSGVEGVRVTISARGYDGVAAPTGPANLGPVDVRFFLDADIFIEQEFFVETPVTSEFWAAIARGADTWLTASTAVKNIVDFLKIATDTSERQEELQKKISKDLVVTAYADILSAGDFTGDVRAANREIIELVFSASDLIELQKNFNGAKLLEFAIDRGPLFWKGVKEYAERAAADPPRADYATEVDAADTFLRQLKELRAEFSDLFDAPEFRDLVRYFDFQSAILEALVSYERFQGALFDQEFFAADRQYALVESALGRADTIARDLEASGFSFASFAIAPEDLEAALRQLEGFSDTEREAILLAAMDALPASFDDAPSFDAFAFLSTFQNLDERSLLGLFEDDRDLFPHETFLGPADLEPTVIPLPMSASAYLAALMVSALIFKRRSQVMGLAQPFSSPEPRAGRLCNRLSAARRPTG